ncbi:putative cytochrome P450 [Talaromyces proteolyticus]|uniref:Cytochrome P450 n=1 Tax=Talaromyces proteolyticus TaxID=1131652 RepID=A0AAD4L2H2_9EURO|nr:putative cytochrome P450 [Talaromyces proteolyticus]KAH8703344.1 putative cytochrome P450 [Talaromyces proteolyticus]
MERIVFFASLNTFFGKRLQLGYPEIFDDFQIFNKTLYVGVRSKLAFRLNPRADQARRRLLDNFDKWVDTELEEWEDNGPVWNEKWGVKLNWERENLLRKHDFTMRGRACSHVSFLYVMNLNSAPMTTWFLINIIQSPNLLSRFQAECQECLIPSSDGKLAFDLQTLKARPLVQGVWKESLRLGSASAVARVLAQDIELDGYMLKQGSVIFIPVQLLHYNNGIFPDPEAFDPDRWVFNEEDTSQSEMRQKQMAAHLRPFGGGNGICSGRFIAEDEVILAAATLLTKYDFYMQGQVQLNPRALGIMSPKDKVWVKIRAK